MVGSGDLYAARSQASVELDIRNINNVPEILS